MKNLLFSIICFILMLSVKANAVIINELEIRNNERISKETISTYGKII